MHAASATSITRPETLRARARKARHLQNRKEQGLTQFSAFLSEQRLAELDQFLACQRGRPGPDGREVKARGDALELILARYFAENPPVGSSTP